MLGALAVYAPLAVAILCASVVTITMGLFGKKRTFAGKHAFVTGGSEGIGRAIAEQLLLQGASQITLVARSQSKLEQACTSLTSIIEEKGLSASVRYQAADVTDWHQVQKAVAGAEAAHGPINLLVCCAGTSTPGRILEQDMSIFEHTLAVNYFGVVHTVKAAVPGMVARREGQVVIIASVMAVLGFSGYGSYAPTKWAARGFADCLRNEVAGSGVTVHVGYPPDTDTPGFSNEAATMPPEGRRIQDIGGTTVFPPAKVAQSLLQGVLRGSYHLPGPDFGLNVLVSPMAGYSPRVHNLFLECLLAPIMVLFARIAVPVADSVVKKERGW